MTNDYIRREDAIDKINERQRKLIYCFGFENDAVKIMDIAKSIVIAIPSADVAPVVRCDDCVYYGSRRWCELHSSVFDDNAFCSYGERSGEQDGR